MNASDPAAVTRTWFADGDEPYLVGTRCRTCGTYHFPPERTFCRNPGCAGEDLEEVPLSRRGTVWSWTTNHYDGPPPTVLKAPYTVAAVELARERMIVLGLTEGDVEVGDEVEVTVGPLDEDTQVWRWRRA